MTELSFSIDGARVDRYAASPSLLLQVRLREMTGARVDAITLRGQIQLEVGRRRYLPDESVLLVELFGEPGRYSDTLKPLLWAHVAQTVLAFETETEFELAVPCGYDFDVAANKYLASLQEGAIPINVLFAGQVFVDGPQGVKAELVPWSCEARFSLPVSVWREAVNVFFPNTAWIRVNRDLFDELRRFKIAAGLPTWDAALERLCELARAKR